MSLLEGIIDSRNNPLAVVEDIAANNNWAFERSGEDEVTIVSKGRLDRLPAFLHLDERDRGAASGLRLRHEDSRRRAAPRCSG